MIQNFSNLVTVPQSNDLIDTALSSTNRKTPTIVRSKYDTNRIRNFYERKVKFASEQFILRLKRIIEEFPVLEDLHPFYMDLIGVLYDRDHYKIALGQVNSASHRIETIAKEHIRILNFGDSLYKCKEIKKTALGKMATAVKKISKSLVYLEEVRQHMSRLPSVDTQARTIIICGFPNVGKSSFVNKVSRANVEVQNYAFTTKNIYVGHFGYNNLEWQIIDTPGILDKPLEDRNSIEMLSITVLAHLKAAVLFFIDVSESCGYSIDEQISLFNNLTPLLNMEIVIVLSKCDLLSESALAIFKGKAGAENGSDNFARLKEFLAEKKNAKLCIDDNESVEHVRKTVCDILLDARMAEKGARINEFMHRIKPYVPPVEKFAAPHPAETEERLGPNVFLREEEMESIVAKDIIPEIYEGKNICDYIRPNLAEEVTRLEREAEGEKLRDFDVMTAEERAKYEECNNARLDAIARAHFARRASIPESWKNERLPASERVVRPIIKVEKEVHNRRARTNMNGKYYDKNPRHLVRPTGNKFSKK